MSDEVVVVVPSEGLTMPGVFLQATKLNTTIKEKVGSSRIGLTKKRFRIKIRLKYCRSRLDYRACLRSNSEYAFIAP